MKVKELIEALQLCYAEDEVEAFGPNHDGRFVLRQVIGAESARRKSITQGDCGPVVVINTAIYNR